MRKFKVVAHAFSLCTGRVGAGLINIGSSRDRVT